MPGRGRAGIALVSAGILGLAFAHNLRARTPPRSGWPWNGDLDRRLHDLGRDGRAAGGRRAGYAAWLYLRRAAVSLYMGLTRGADDRLHPARLAARPGRWGLDDGTYALILYAFTQGAMATVAAARNLGPVRGARRGRAEGTARSPADSAAAVIVAGSRCCSSAGSGWRRTSVEPCARHKKPWRVGESGLGRSWDGSCQS